jgi:hypothetical protein
MNQTLYAEPLSSDGPLAIDHPGPFGPADLLGARKHNASLGIAQLPFELLSAILVESTLYVPPWKGFSTSVTPWVPEVSHLCRAIALSHVCHGWREACLALPALWNAPLYPQREPRELDALMLARAQELPLAIIWSTDDDDVHFLDLPDWDTPEEEDPPDNVLPPLQTFLKDNMARIRHLYVSQEMFPVNFFDVDTPVLETAYIGCRMLRGDRSPAFPRAPRLRCLAFPSMGLEFSSPVLASQHLTQLTLCGPSWAIERHSVINILDTIAQAPQLTEFTLTSSRFRAGLWDNWTSEGKPLFRQRLPPMPLEKVTLIGDFVGAVAILEHLELSSEIHLTLEIPRDGCADWPEMAALCNFLRPHMEVHHHAPLRARFSQDSNTLSKNVIQIELESSHERMLTLLGGDYFQPTVQEAFNLHIKDMVRERLSWDRLQELRVDLPADIETDVDVETLDAVISLEDQLNMARWIFEMFADSETLKVIRCSGALGLAALLRVLHEFEMSSSSGDTKQLVFPALITVVIRDVEMEDLCIWILSNTSPTNLGVLTERLVERARTSRSVDTLIFEDCNFGMVDTLGIQKDLELRGCAAKVEIRGLNARQAFTG